MYAIEPISPTIRRSIAQLIFISDPGFALPALARDDQLVARFGRILGPSGRILDFWIDSSDVEAIYDTAQRNERAAGVIGM
jgi:hypothetical protein